MHIDHYHGGYFSTFNPGALRTSNVANAFALAGHTVTIITGDRDQADLAESPSRFNLDSRVDVSAGGPPHGGRLAGRIPRRINPLARGFGRARPADLILLFGPTPSVFGHLNAHAMRQNLPLAVDVDEWMGPRDFSWRSWLTLYPLQYERFMRQLPRDVRAGLAISETMRKHLSACGGRVTVVPPLHSASDTNAVTGRRSDRTRLLLPGVRRGGMGKDRCSVQLVSEAIHVAPWLADSIEVDIVGGVEEIKSARVVSRLAQTVRVRDHGSVAWPQARELVLNADWLVALRDPKPRRIRYAFPSKVTEALVAGTPVIANDYSDMRKYLDRERMGILVERLDAEAVADALAEAIRRPLNRSTVEHAARQLYTPDAASAVLDRFLSREVRLSGTRLGNSLRSCGSPTVSETSFDQRKLG